MKNSIIAAACLIFSAVQPASAKDEPLRLAPSSKWRLDYAEDSCKLMRYFGTDKNEVTFVLERFGPTDSFWLWLAGKPLYMSKERRVTLQFGPSEPEQQAAFYRAQADGKPSIVFVNALALAPLSQEQKEWVSATGGTQLAKPIGEEREKTVTELFIAKEGRNLILELGSMGDPFKAMRACTDDLLSTWGFDKAKHQGLSRLPQPITPPSKWLRSSDYPRMQLEFRERAIVHVRLDVDDKGEPTGCHIQGAIGGDDFKTAVCNGIMRRARFQPALDESGTPTAWYYRNDVRFIID